MLGKSVLSVWRSKEKFSLVPEGPKTYADEHQVGVAKGLDEKKSLKVPPPTSPVNVLKSACTSL